jgi:hypothetical protein
LWRLRVVPEKVLQLPAIQNIVAIGICLHDGCSVGLGDFTSLKFVVPVTVQSLQPAQELAGAAQASTGFTDQNRFHLSCGDKVPPEERLHPVFRRYSLTGHLLTFDYRVAYNTQGERFPLVASHTFQSQLHLALVGWHAVTSQLESFRTSL